MGKLETIKQKINQLDAGSFQNLCDSYLSKIGYRNIVSLGSEAGTRKTTQVLQIHIFSKRMINIFL